MKEAKIMMWLPLLLVVGCMHLSKRETTIFRCISSLEVEGDFYKEKDVKAFVPCLPAFLALSVEDLANGMDMKPEDVDLVSLAIVSSQLAEIAECQNYVRRHFKNIHIPSLKFVWAGSLALNGRATTEIIQYLRQALHDNQDLSLFRDGLSSEEWNELLQMVRD